MNELYKVYKKDDANFKQYNPMRFHEVSDSPMHNGSKGSKDQTGKKTAYHTSKYYSDSEEKPETERTNSHDHHVGTEDSERGGKSRRRRRRSGKSKRRRGGKSKRRRGCKSRKY